MTSPREERASYRFGPLERRGVLAGWRGGQVAVVAASLVVAVLLVRSSRPGPGLAGAVGVVVVGLVAACWPYRGRTAEEWAPVVGAWALAARRRLHRSAVPSLGLAIGRREVPDTSRRPPPPLAGCRILAPPVGSGLPRLGVVHDARARTYTAALAAAGAAFVLLGADDQAARVSAWSSVLAGLAREGTLAHRLQWLASTRPGDSGLPGLTWPDGARDTAAARSYAQVLERAGASACRREVLVALSLHSDRAGRAIRAAGGGEAGACAVLSQELRALQQQLANAEILVLGALSPAALATALRQPAMLRQPAGDAPAGRTPWPWPMATEVTWSAYRTDETWHATYWIAEWPRVEVGPGFLVPLLLHPGARHTVGLTMEPMSPLRAAREVRHARTADVADAELRRRGGFLDSARRQREAETVARREVELADGHTEYRFSGYVRVTAGSPEELEAACGRVEQAAGQARLELRRLHGQQDDAFTWTLPLARGLS